VHRTAREALREELVRLRRLLSCVTPQVLQMLPARGERRLGSQSVEEREVNLGADPVALRGGLALTADQWLTAVEDHDRGGWRAELTGYLYAFDSADGKELIAFHWHPFSASEHTEPHLHVGGALAGAHVPTGGPVTVAEVLRFAITDLGVEPARSDWKQVLEQRDPDDVHTVRTVRGYRIRHLRSE
jgi:hypothetical protein